MAFISGYWEIQSVKKGNKTVKNYQYNTTIDYFEMITDSTGYRKKVSPTLDGKFKITQHESPFFILIEDNRLNIYYTVNNVTFKETIINANEHELIISNDQGFIYTYKSYRQFLD